MNWNRIPRLSLKAKVVVANIAIFVIGIWSLAYYASLILRNDMQTFLAEQMFSTAAYLANDINQELGYRYRALEFISASVGSGMMGDAAAIQAFLEQRPLLQRLFNGGVSVHRLDGTVAADVPLSTGRVGVNFMEVDAVAIALKEGRASVGRPVMGKILHGPAFGMAVPVHDAQGKVIGAAAGVINLGMPSFLDRLAQGHYGRGGGYLLVVPQSRQIVAASDKSRIMEVLPAPGVIPGMDRFIQGYEGSDIFVNAHGAELVTTAKAVPLSGWLAVVSLPTEEAFAPIRSMQQRMILGALFLTLMAGVLVWWMLRRQLSPLLAAAEQLGAMADTGRPLHPLPVADGEVGHLFGGFNRLLETLRQREEALRESEFRWKFALEGAGAGAWDIDHGTGEVHHSRRYQQMVGYGEDEFEGSIGKWQSHVHPEDAPRVMELLQSYLDGRTTRYSAEYRLRRKDGSYIWVNSTGMAVTRAEDGKPLRMMGAMTDISERKEEELKLARVERDLWQALRQVEQKERSKSRFLAATSHDLRQPLFAAQLLVDGLASTPLDVQQLNSVNRVQQSLKAMSNQLQLFLDLSRLEDANLQLFKQYQPVQSLFEDIAELYGPIAKQANVRLLFHPGEFVLQTDARLLARLIGTLVDNAIKFSPRGTVLVCARRNKGSHMIQVRDNGIGIDDIHRGAIFEDFYQIDNEERDPSSGYGLGLAIAGRIARLLGIKIHVASALAEGSVFSLVMPNGDSSLAN